MAQRSTATRRLVFLPDNLKVFLRRRLVELGGIGVFLLAGLLALLLATYSPDDPSLNNATSAAAGNALGRPGAFIADIALQTLGIGAAAVVLVLAGWAWRVVSHRGVRWYQVALLPLAVLLLAATAAGFSSVDPNRLPAGFGGVAGALVTRSALLPLLHNIGLAVGPALIGLFLLPLAIVAAGAAIGVRPAELGAGLAAGWRWIGNRLARHRADDDEEAFEAPKAARRAEPRLKPKKPVVEDDEEDEDDVLESLPAVVRRLAKPRVEKQQRQPRASQGKLDLAVAGSYQLPPMTLLAAVPAQRSEQVNEEALEQNARLLESTLEDFGVNGEITKVRPGPVVTLYELEPAPGTKSSRVIGLSDDIARSMSSVSARIAVVPGRNAIGIELPNARRETVYLRELLTAEAYEKAPVALPLALGKDIGGGPVVADLSRMPHLLVAGTTGSGKSVAINTMILSLLYRLSPEECRLIMIDPKMLELSVYDGIPHLLAPVVTEPGKAIVALKWAVREMEDRYRKMSELGVRNIGSYNQRLAEARAKNEQLSRTVQTGFDLETGKPVFEDKPLSLDPLPFIVVIVDELADLMLVAGKDIEASVQRLAQMARAAGLHLIMATQRPSVDVITGTIKANFPTRISFQVTSKIDSRTILGEQGAEQLLGMGDMLYMPGAGRLQRVHGPFVSDTEVEQVVAYLKAQGEPEYLEAVTADIDGGDGPGAIGGAEGGEVDELYDRAVALVTRERKCSTSFIQRYLQIGYNRAARIVERMEAEGVVGRANHVGKREVLARDIDDREN
ncbi:FtsK/SpoIIIE family DNA translocase [Desertibaculum subflavum]|uniref:FtsK/SpoIIIE family DNA translocase n=1 Tax=Desertibaculum subflavum TaxID=2268458 RepID=UPI000E65F1E9